MSNETSEEEVARLIVHTLTTMKELRPQERDAKGAREWAVAITELEKAFAYFQVFVVDYIHSSNE